MAQIRNNRCVDSWCHQEMRRSARVSQVCRRVAGAGWRARRSRTFRSRRSVLARVGCWVGMARVWRRSGAGGADVVCGADVTAARRASRGSGGLGERRPRSAVPRVCRCLRVGWTHPVRGGACPRRRGTHAGPCGRRWTRACARSVAASRPTGQHGASVSGAASVSVPPRRLDPPGPGRGVPTATWTPAIGVYPGREAPHKRRAFSRPFGDAARRGRRRRQRRRGRCQPRRRARLRAGRRRPRGWGRWHRRGRPPTGWSPSRRR
ncbi:hypothetical protein SAMN04488561_6198 [Jiangella alba]|uniref:Uncharacterized protein n=1 Tax=Jiangella alba TaxID=561176 RepID=A0A1H5PWD1_9ACTN|nr:hypothetical protein SAMN04488561_6198 [Jiangella alba]